MKLNRVTLEGNLTQDAEVKATTTGKKLQRFTLAVNDDYKPSGSTEWVKRVYYVDCYCSTKIYDGLKKGVRVNIDGKLITKNWDDPKTQTKRKFTNIEVFGLSIVKTNAQLEEESIKIPYTKTEDIEEEISVPF